MSAPTSDLAFRVADRIKAEPPWEVYADRSRRYEIHLNGTTVELSRGPIALEGYGIRLFRRRGEKIGAGFDASSDPSDAGIHKAVEEAEAIARHSEFPTKSVELPSGSGGVADGATTVDRALWDRPFESIDAYLSTLLQQFEGTSGCVPSFGSLRATLTETTLANSAGLHASFSQTLSEFELAVKASGGPEGAPPGEYWVNDLARRLEPGKLPDEVRAWCEYARDVRRSVPPPTGDLPVVLPASVLSGILPSVVGYRLSGAARLRQLSPELGARIAASDVTLTDDGTYPWAPATAPIDDEGCPQTKRTLVSSGNVSSLLYDSLHAGAFSTPATGPASRARFIGYPDWKRFLRPPSLGSSTLVVSPGSGGSDEEICEAAGEGIWVQQLGWARPNALSGVFGGEIRIGYRIRGGKRAEPVRGGIVGGTALGPPGAATLLSNIAGIGSQMTLSDEIASPTLLVRPLSVAGSSG
jgi:predicted Zn-dependent protease